MAQNSTKSEKTFLRNIDRLSSLPPNFKCSTTNSQGDIGRENTEYLRHDNLSNDSAIYLEKHPKSSSHFVSCQLSPETCGQIDVQSPSTSSVMTDEDSGYGHTVYSQRQYAGSTTSISNSGLDTSRDELLQVMTEDLATWFSHLYSTTYGTIDTANFYDRISDGVLLCRHASELYLRMVEQWPTMSKTDRYRLKAGGVPMRLPPSAPTFQTRGLHKTSIASSSFVSRVNVSNFLGWCKQLGMPDSVLFESEDLVCGKNPRNVAVCLLELARIGGKIGMDVPDLVRLEVEIAEEEAELIIMHDLPEINIKETSLSSNSSNRDDVSQCGSDEINPSQIRSTRAAELRRMRNEQKVKRTKQVHPVNGEAEINPLIKVEKKRPVVDMRSLDEIVRDLLSQCTCKQRFPMIRVGEGRYLFGDKSTQIFVRILRNHVMVRVGGGWDTLNHFLAKYDECRKVNSVNPQSQNEASQNLSENSAGSVDPSDVEHVLTSIQSPPTDNPLPRDSPIKAQGKLNAIRKSPSRELDDVTQKQANYNDACINKGQAVTNHSRSKPSTKCPIDHSTPKVTTGATQRPRKSISTQGSKLDTSSTRILKNLNPTVQRQLNSNRNAERRGSLIPTPLRANSSSRLLDKGSSRKAQCT